MFGDSGGVGNCTLEDMDSICIEFQNSELHNTRYAITISYKIRNSSPKAWFNCTLSQNQEQLHYDAVNHILGQIS